MKELKLEEVVNYVIIRVVILRLKMILLFIIKAVKQMMITTVALR